ncbi:NAD(P)-dependent oxidoreductase [Tanticharoenia sakaeratensis]|uniref:2-hydroxy-3-oxopropionate reductase n=1 Tax=Tanticharoenia sakaeratensis NBRC 103193 TaxID=1231623 RepID=A0A0D6MMK5_9PROT|nr:NAD(P)-dependent oxidoreductase [Tanticharoenia sakaeratensis]GAN54655.1 2-hydroxy-3-oxopropionate reductase [Tanticharoenia sakaeratensis NBRC 103193]GBQ16737.1 3-hydroxyisobutyrate dehydrogenase [Tanticharoenia sakaeratensis NBRC 103193]
MRIGFLGTGLMGAPMARRLAGAGFAVSAWNRSREKATALADAGIAAVDQLAEVARDARAVIGMLSSDDACRDVLLGDGGVLAAMAPGSILIVMSSISVPMARELADAAAARGVACLDAPVSGGVAGAEAGTLAIMVGGDAAVFEDARDILRPMGRPVRIGPVGTGALAKLANQMIVAGTIALVAEAFVLAEQGGADPARLREALAGGFADSIILQRQGQRMIVGDFVPGGPAKYQIKDSGAALALAGEVGLDLPVARLVDGLFRELVAAGDGELDHSALIRQVRRRNGLG